MQKPINKDKLDYAFGQNVGRVSAYMLALPFTRRDEKLRCINFTWELIGELKKSNEKRKTNEGK
jgi:hypothetical protein